MECLLEARDRATVTRCTEWQRFQVPSGWSVPCVIAFRSYGLSLVSLGSIGRQCKKSANEAVPGTVLPRETLQRSSVHLYILRDEFLNYTKLHRYLEGEPNYVAALQDLMICGGCEVLNDDGTKRPEPLAWAHRQMFPSCGRAVVFASLPMEGWVKTGGKLWFCRRCYSRHFRRIDF